MVDDVVERAAPGEASRDGERGDPPTRFEPYVTHGIVTVCMASGGG